MNFFPPPSPEYTCGPNSSLVHFIETHKSNKACSVTESFNKKFVGVKKTGPIYSMHRYWTKQPINIIKEYINYFCPPGGLVLDPFCGSGTTGTAALLSNRNVILSDLSKIATFISKNYTEKTQIDQVNSEITNIYNKIKPTLFKYYSTKCSRCYSVVEIKDWIYSESFLCTKCNNIINFIPEPITWEKIVSLKHKKLVYCKYCEENIEKSTLSHVYFKPIGLRFRCRPCKIRKQFKLLDKQDQDLLCDPQLDSIYDRTPFIELPLGVNTKQPKAKHITRTNQFFTPITLFVLSKLWSNILAVQNVIIRSKIQFVFNSILFRVTKLYRLRVNGQGGILSGTLYVPSLSQDINVWDVFIERYKKIKKGWSVLNSNLPPDYANKRLISTQSATNLSMIPSNSIDYIYTDPPYGGNINYSELNLIWESWFGLATNTTDEVIINETGQKKDILKYAKLLHLSLNEIYRVLKPGHWCTLVFNTSSPKLWGKIQHLVINSGFILDKGVSQVESNMTTAKQTQSKRTARRYMLMNLLKPQAWEKVYKSDNTDQLRQISKDSLKRKIIKYISGYLLSKENHCASYDEIYDEILSTFLTDYQIHELDLGKILEENYTHIGKDSWSFE